MDFVVTVSTPTESVRVDDYDDVCDIYEPVGTTFEVHVEALTRRLSVAVTRDATPVPCSVTTVRPGSNFAYSGCMGEAESVVRVALGADGEVQAAVTVRLFPVAEE